jgi:hypothetical protein
VHFDIFIHVDEAISIWALRAYRERQHSVEGRERARAEQGELSIAVIPSDKTKLQVNIELISRVICRKRKEERKLK